jgi:hypothetical protein
VPPPCHGSRFLQPQLPHKARHTPGNGAEDGSNNIALVRTRGQQGKNIGRRVHRRRINAKNDQNAMDFIDKYSLSKCADFQSSE